MIKILHIPTGIILINIFPDYDTLKWFFTVDKNSMSTENAINSDNKHNIFTKIIRELDKINFINDKNGEHYIHYDTTVYAFQKRYCIEEFEVIYD